MKLYPIKQQWIEGLPQIPYSGGKGAYEGVVAHCTDSANHSGGDTPTNERSYESRTWENAFVHYFVGVENNSAIILETAPADYISYGAGHDANMRFVNVELCMYDDLSMFKLAYDAYVWLLTKLLHDRKLGVTPAASDCSGTLWAHADVTKYYGGTHQDPIAYLASHGITWTQHVQNVTDIYNEMEANEMIIPTLPKVIANNIIDSYLTTSWKSCEDQRAQAEKDGNADDAAAWLQLRDWQHTLANELRKASGQPEQ